MTSIVLTAFAIVSSKQSRTNVDFAFGIGSMYGTTVTKEDLQNVVTVVDILPPETDWPSFPIHTLHIMDLNDNSKRSESGKSITFNEAQLNLLRSLDYSENFKIVGNCKGKHRDVPDKEEFDLTYFISIVPEKIAVHPEGIEGLVRYLMEASKEARSNIEQDKLDFGRIIFNVNKSGEIADVRLDASCGYEDIDNTLSRLISEAPGKWEPAKTHSGEIVEQEMTFFFGRVGC